MNQGSLDMHSAS